MEDKKREREEQRDEAQNYQNFRDEFTKKAERWYTDKIDRKLRAYKAAREMEPTGFCKDEMGRECFQYGRWRHG
eukprot:2029803-Pleurochrysis_carterae.AAC.1